MRRRTVVAIAVVLVGAAVAAVAWPRRRRERAAEPAAAGVDTQSPRPGVLDAMPVAAKPAAQETSATSAAHDDEVAAASPRTGGVTVTGIVRFDDGTVPSGATYLSVHPVGSPNDWTAATVSEGRFRLAVPAEGAYQVANFIWGTEAYPVERLPQLDLRDGATIVLTLDCKHAPTVIVSDAQTHAPVPGAYAFVRLSNDEFIDVGAVDGTPSDVRSRTPRLDGDDGGTIRLQPSWKVTDLEVGAPGHARVIVAVPHRSDEPLRVELDPAGSLDLTVARWASLGDVTVLLRGADGDEWTIRSPDEGGRGRYDGIPAGAYTVIVRHRRGDEVGAACARAAVELSAGVVTSLRVEPARESSPAASLLGALRLPKEWAVERVSLWLRGIDGSTEGVFRAASVVRVADERLSFSVDSLPAGRYRAVVNPIGWSTSLDVLPAGGEVSITVPSPRTVEISVRDASSEAVVPTAQVWWVSTDEPVANRSVLTGTFDGTRQCFRVQVPHGLAGQILVVAPGHVGAGFDDVSLRTESDGGPLISRDVRLLPAGTVTAAIRVDARPYSHVGVHLHAVDDDSATGSYWFRSDSPCECVAPGRYRAWLDSVPGFVSEPPRVVDVKAGETTEVAFDLTRK